MNDQNGQYRRPRPHFTPEETMQPTITRRQLLTGSALMLGLALLMILAMIPLRTNSPAETEAAEASRDTGKTLAADCTVLQQMTYTPCGHSLTRRQALPAELVGKDREALAAAYSKWQVTAFSPTEVSMGRSFSLHCPQHIVLMPDEGGQLCAWQNKYGDALALVKELGTAVSELPESSQDEVRQGKGFDSLEMLEKWVEGVGS